MRYPLPFDREVETEGSGERQLLEVLRAAVRDI